jgi:ubiquinone/menaquinone biosynthesis C-methylase UbiE
MPGHWLLARMGKRVLRPGGLELTNQMLAALAITPTDDVVEFAPGLGVTARRALQRNPATYTGIERDEAAAATVWGYLTEPRQRCLVGTAEETGLDDQSATVIYGEAMLTMQPPAQKARIVREAYRVLRPGGRYAIHELSLTPDTLDDATKATVERDLSQAIRVGARPLTGAEWRALLEAEGFQVQSEARAPMHLLELQRMIQDEGLLRALRIGVNVLRNPTARQWIGAMRQVFRQHAAHLGAIALVAVKPTPEYERN